MLLMPQIILIESDDTFKSILKLNLLKVFGCDVIEKNTAADAISLLEILPDVDMVICRDQVGIENTRQRLAAHFEKEKLIIPLLVITPTQNWENIIQLTGKILKLTPLTDNNTDSSEFVPIGIEYFFNITSTSMGCDVYIRVKKGDEYQYIKRLHSTDSFARADIEKYMGAGLKHFYISKNHFSAFVTFVTSQLVLKLEDKKLISTDRIKLTSEAYSITLELIQSMGIDDNTVGMAEESIKSMQKSLGEDNALSTFLQSLKSNKLTYGYSHVHLCCIILHKVVASFDWESPAIRDKLTFIAYFHDISLPEHLMRIYSDAAPDFLKLSEEEKKIVLNHAYQSSVIIDKFPNLPQGIGTILKEHHGTKNGVGFTSTLSIAISPISMMFMVVEHFVDEFLKIDGPPKREDFENIFKILEPRYRKLTYEQTLYALKEMVLGKKK